MKKLTTLMVPAVLAFGMTVGAADAAEKRGHITALDAANNTLSLSSNWNFTYGDNVAVDNLNVGDNVKVIFKIKKTNRGNEYIAKRIKTLN